MNTLSLNFVIKTGAFPVCHDPPWTFEYSKIPKDWIRRCEHELFAIVIHRDGRDVLPSLYRWSTSRLGGSHKIYIEAGKRKKEGAPTIMEATKGMSFSEWLRSDKFIGDFKRKGDTPVIYWERYTREILEFDAYHIRYEDVNTKNFEDDNPILLDLEQRYGLKRRPKQKVLAPQKKLCAPLSHKGIIGDWKDYFTEDDLDYFIDISGDVMDKLYPEGWPSGKNL
jgi:hypothetical protein